MTEDWDPKGPPARAVAVLVDRHIKWSVAGSRGLTINVPLSRAGEARIALAHLRKDEGIALTVIGRRADGTYTTE